jgi:hypothetical protein
MLPSSSNAFKIGQLKVVYRDVKMFVVVQVELSEMSLDLQFGDSTQFHLTPKDLSRVYKKQYEEICAYAYLWQISK